MKGPNTPVLDPRQLEVTLTELGRRRPAFVPGWLPADQGPGAALDYAYARLAQAAAAAVNRAPEKNQLAFFELLGLEPLPAQAARVPVVFRSLPASRGSARLPQATV